MRIAPETLAFTALLGLFAALPALSIDISAPTLPLLPAALDTTQTVASLTLSFFMAGFALGHLGGGYLSDKAGRRPLLLAGLACFTLAGAACSVASSGEGMVAARLIQGLGAGMCSVISFAMVQDLFRGDAARIKRSYVTAIFGAVPILAPALGAVVTNLFGWRSVHGVLAVAGALLFVIAQVGVGESRGAVGQEPPERAGEVPPPILGDIAFVRNALTNALSYGVIFAYIAGSPVVIMGQMGYSSAVFSGLFACTAAALSAGAWVCGRFVNRGVSASALIGPAMLASVCGAVLLAGLGLSRMSAGPILVPPLLAILFARGVLAPNLQHLAIERQRTRAGLASAVVGVSQLMAGALASAVVAVLLGFLGVNGVAIPMLAFALAASVVWAWPRR